MPCTHAREIKTRKRWDAKGNKTKAKVNTMEI